MPIPVQIPQPPVAINPKPVRWRWPRIALALVVGLLLLAVMLPNMGCLGSSTHDSFSQGMWHVGPFLFFPNALLYMAYIVLAMAFVIFGTLRRNKFEFAGWAMLTLWILFGVFF